MEGNRRWSGGVARGARAHQEEKGGLIETKAEVADRWLTRTGLARTRWLTSPGALILYLLLTVALFRGVWRHLSTQVIGVGGDPLQHVWFIRWLPFALIHGQNPFFTDYLDFPAGANLLWNTSMPLQGLILWPVTAAWGPVVAYNLLIAVAPPLSAWTAFLLFRRFVSSSPAAWVGGALFGFSPYMIAHSLGHPTLTSVYLVPLILLVLDSIVRGPCRHPVLLALALAVLAGAQLLVSEEILASTALVVFLILAIAAGLYPQQARASVRQAARVLLLSGGMFTVLAAWPLAFQLFGPGAIRGGPLHPTGIVVTDLLNFWVPTQMQLLAPAPAVRLTDQFTGNYSEWNAYLGLPLTALLVVAAARYWASGPVRVAALGASLIAILSLGVTIHVGGRVSPLPVFALALLYLPFYRRLPAFVMVLLAVVGWLVLGHAPLFDNLITSRLMLYCYLLLGALLALVLERIAAGGDLRRLALATGAAVLALLPLLPVQPYPRADATVPQFFTGSGIQALPEGSVALVVPMSDSPRAMLWQASSGMRFRMPQGYVFVPLGSESTYRTPPSVTSTALEGLEVGRSPQLDDATLLRRIRNELAGWRVGTVILGPAPYSTREVTLLSRVLGKAPREEGGVLVWSNLDLRA